MNSEKEKLLQTANREKELQSEENNRVRQDLEVQVADLRKQN